MRPTEALKQLGLSADPPLMPTAALTLLAPVVEVWTTLVARVSMFFATWSVVTVICSTVDDVSDTLDASESMFFATFSTDVIICVTEPDVSCTFADSASDGN